MTTTLIAIIISSITIWALSIIFYQLKVKNLRNKLASLENLNQEKDLKNTELGFELKQRNQEIELMNKNEKKLTSQLADIEQTMSLKFENLSNKIMQESIHKIDQNSVKNIGHILSPLREKIVTFQQKIEYLYNEESKERHSLKNEIKNISEIGNQLNKEALNLAKALKGDVKAQGNWGEMVLEKILENSGLREGQEYITQAKGLTLKTDEGITQRPDVIVTLPENKHIIIDSKVSLTHYERYISCENQQEKPKFLKSFNDSIEKHVQELSAKSYGQSDKLKSPDFVLMFFPIEGAYSLAIQQNPNLFYWAWDRSIIIVGPTTLMATLKTIHSIWRQDKSNKNALNIASESGKMYDKMSNFLTDLIKIGDQIKRTEDTYEASLNKLKNGKGNILSRLEYIKSLGAKAKKQIEIEHDEFSETNPNNINQ